MVIFCRSSGSSGLNRLTLSFSISLSPDCLVIVKTINVGQCHIYLLFSCKHFSVKLHLKKTLHWTWKSDTKVRFMLYQKYISSGKCLLSRCRLPHFPQSWFKDRHFFLMAWSLVHNSTHISSQCSFKKNWFSLLEFRILYFWTMSGSTACAALDVVWLNISYLSFLWTVGWQKVLRFFSFTLRNKTIFSWHKHKRKIKYAEANMQTFFCST